MSFGVTLGPKIAELLSGDGNGNKKEVQLDTLGYAYLMLGIKLLQTPEGLKVIKALGTEFIKGMFKTLNFAAQASAANPIAAWANPILISGVLERFGLLPPRFNANFHLGITVISGFEMYTDILNDVADALPWNLIKGEAEAQYPTTLKFASPEEEEKE